jgi:5-formyltetrahydrofolate cyclo-ligase
MTKEKLRQEFLDRRNALRTEDLHRRDRAIADSVLLQISSFSSACLHTFLPQREKNEINTMLFIGEIWRSGQNIQIVAPRVVPGTREMEHFLLTPETTLIENKWGIPEPDPSTSQRVDIQNIGHIIIPLLAFDVDGYRVGYGGGFYDRFLANCKPSSVKTGLSFFEPVQKIENLDEFDVKMDYCFTPTQTYNWIK